MIRGPFHTAVVFTDASARKDIGGIGFVALVGRRALVGSRHLGRCADSTIAEAEAVDVAVEAARDRFTAVRRIIVISDSHAVVDAIEKDRKVTGGIGRTIIGMLAMARLSGIHVEARWTKGHSQARPISIGNALAHALADLGRTGTTKTMRIQFDRDWRRNITRFDHRLQKLPLPKWLGVPLVSHFLQVEERTVLELICNSHLDVGSAGISRDSFLKVRDYMLARDMIPAWNTKLAQ